MSAAEHIAPMSVKDYLAWEETQDQKYEYIGGIVYAMAGGTAIHATIALNVASHLRNQLRGSTCRTFVADLKIRTQVSEQDIFYYPDVFVACDPDDAHAYYRERPRLVVEVLSKSTRRTDQQEKRLTYQGIDSVQEILFIEQDSPRCNLLRRSGAEWQHLTADGLDACLELHSIDLNLPLETVYEDVSFE